MFELGTHKTKLWRSSKNEWFGGTEGLLLGLQQHQGPGRSAGDRRQRRRPAGQRRSSSHPTAIATWLQLYDKYKGKIDADFGKLAFTTPPLAAFHSLDAKFTTTDMAKELKTWALFGPPLGRTWEPTIEERKKFPEIPPLVSNPWTILHAGAPAAAKTKVSDFPVVDLHDPGNGDRPLKERTQPAKNLADTSRPGMAPCCRPATPTSGWRLPSPTYEHIVALENALKVRSDGKLTKTDRDQLALALFAHRADYELASRTRPEKALQDTQSDVRTDEWYRVAANKGVLLLAELRDAGRRDVRSPDGRFRQGARGQTGENRAIRGSR